MVINPELGKALVAQHLSEMSAMSRKKWPPIVEIEGYEIVEDRPYQGFDNDPTCEHHQWCMHIPEVYPEPRFWCRSITVRRLSDGVQSWSVGPQADAYNRAIENLEKI